jgi:hypothetical protein
METREVARFWMVWREGSGGCRHRHFSKADALLEAQRLAAIHPNQPFYVLKACGGAVADDPQVKALKPKNRLIDPDDQIPF